MGFGFALGGVAKGLIAQDELAQKQTIADAAAARANAQIGIALKGLDLRERTLADTQSRNLQTQVNKHISDSVKVVMQIIKNGQATNTPPDKLMNAVAPLLDDIDAWGLRIGSDTSKLRLGITNLLKTGVTAAPKVWSTLEDIKAKLSRGEKLTPGQQKLYDDSLHSNAIQDLIDQALQGSEGGDTGSPAAPAVPATPAAPAGGEVPVRPVQTQTISAPVAASTPAAASPAPASAPAAGQGGIPPIPPGLASIPGLQYSASLNKFYDPAARKFFDASTGAVVNP
jgi:hypothetical protein